MGRRAVAPIESDSDEFIEVQGKFFDDPLGWVLFSFPWGEKGGALEDETGPDYWQTAILNHMGERIRKGLSVGEAVTGAIRIAVASGHGIGKTTLIAWIVLWFMSTRRFPQIVVTANTTAQLTNKTWRELSKWHRMAANHDWFQWTATKFYKKGEADVWFASAQPWSKERAQAFAGTHEKHVLIIFDEASDIDDLIWTTTEGAMTTPGAMWIAFGNPTRNAGRFSECFTKFRHRWAVMRVDSRTAKKANQAQIQEWLEDYGIDSDFFRVRVLGLNPRSDTNQLISLELVQAASMRLAEVDDLAPIVIGVDVARFGDDKTVILVRQGQRILSIRKFMSLDTEQVAARIVEDINDYDPDMTFIDVAGGLGAGPYDILKNAGYRVMDVNPGWKADDDRQFFNKRIEMWWEVREWLRKGWGSLRADRLQVGGSTKGDLIEDGDGPPMMDTTHYDTELGDDLTGPEYGFADRTGLKQLEKKDDMKTRGLASPDLGDALAYTFFMKLARREAHQNLHQRLVDKIKIQTRERATTWRSR